MPGFSFLQEKMDLIDLGVANRAVTLSSSLNILFHNKSQILKAAKLKMREFTHYDIKVSKNGESMLPYTFVVMLTWRCNLRCKGCTFYGGSGMHQTTLKKDLKNEEMTLNDWKKTFDEISKYGTIVNLTGGEPFLREDIIDIVEYIKHKRLICSITTNGTLISEEKLHDLVKNKLDVLILSIDGTEAMHDHLRGVAGSFKKTVRTLRRLDEIKKEYKTHFPYIRINYTLSKDNFRNMIDFVQFMNKLDVEIETISIHHTVFLEEEKAMRHKNCLKNEFGVDSDFMDHRILSGDLIPDPNELIVFKKELDKTKNDYKFNVSFQPELLENEIYEYYENGFLKRFNECHYSWCQVSIDPNGDVQPCSDIIMGNLKHASFEDIWNCDKFRKFRMRLKKKGLLPGCDRCCYLLS